jgi:hypothetical protein
MSVLSKIHLMVIHLCTAYFKIRITCSVKDSHTVLHTLCVAWPAEGKNTFGQKAKEFFNLLIDMGRPQETKKLLQGHHEFKKQPVFRDNVSINSSVFPIFFVAIQARQRCLS